MADEEVDVSEWPPLLRELVDLIGEATTRELAKRCGGLDHVYIPRSPKPDHAWAKVVGIAAWGRIVDAYGGQRLSLPFGARLGVDKKRRILELAEEGLSNREINRRLGVGERWIRRVLSGVDGIAPSKQRRVADPRQTKLFD